MFGQRKDKAPAPTLLQQNRTIHNSWDRRYAIVSQ